MNIYTLFGFTILGFGPFAAHFLRCGFKEGRLGRAWVFAEVITFVVGLVLGIVAVAHSRYPTPNTRLLGFPFLAAVFERSPTGGWVDFLGLRTLPATVGNFAVGLLLPHLFLYAVAWLNMREQR